MQSRQVATVPSRNLVAATLEQVTGNLGLWIASTLKKRKTKMNKHKLRKRRRAARKTSKVHRKG
jgi:hypothetical protein